MLFHLHLFIGSESLINVNSYFIKNINLQGLLPIKQGSVWDHHLLFFLAKGLSALPKTAIACEMCR